MRSVVFGAWPGIGRKSPKWSAELPFHGKSNSSVFSFCVCVRALWCLCVVFVRNASAVPRMLSGLWSLSPGSFCFLVFPSLKGHSACLAFSPWAFCYLVLLLRGILLVWSFSPGAFWFASKSRYTSSEELSFPKIQKIKNDNFTHAIQTTITQLENSRYLQISQKLQSYSTRPVAPSGGRI